MLHVERRRGFFIREFLFYTRVLFYYVCLRIVLLGSWEYRVDVSRGHYTWVIFLCWALGFTMFIRWHDFSYFSFYCAARGKIYLGKAMGQLWIYNLVSSLRIGKGAWAVIYRYTGKIRK